MADKPQGKYDKDTQAAVDEYSANRAEYKRLANKGISLKDTDSLNKANQAEGKYQAARDKIRQLNPDLSELGQKEVLKRAEPDSFKKGGKVKKTGIAKVHRGERVLTVKQAKKYGKTKRYGGKR